MKTSNGTIREIDHVPPSVSEALSVESLMIGGRMVHCYSSRFCLFFTPPLENYTRLPMFNSVTGAKEEIKN
jgi:hypothetical protein